MLFFQRKTDETVVIRADVAIDPGEEIILIIKPHTKSRASIGIEASRNFRILRGEVDERDKSS